MRTPFACVVFKPTAIESICVAGGAGSVVFPPTILLSRKNYCRHGKNISYRNKKKKLLYVNLTFFWYQWG